MKTLQNLTVIAALLTTLASCHWADDHVEQKDAIYRDTLKYTYKTIQQRAADCGDKADSTCTHFEVTYPEFTGQQKLNDSVTHKLLVLFAYDGKADSSLNAYAKRFLGDYETFKKENPDTKMYFEMDSHASVIHQDTNLVAIEVGGYIFQGGAHGGSTTVFINWDTKANKDLTLDDLLVDGYGPKLTAIAEKIFRKDEKLSDTASLATNYFFESNKFALNSNFMVTPVGLRFLYNQYEIKPYAAGQTELLIPYAQIKPLLRPNTVITQFVK
ncbi:DUF3298 and DUF4163 domain-containing protein [Mucilaginibacter sp. UR6-1]|uniref:DUF3298 and DUF4163 domain-containing protein n=1 Tax=Mucilaginibacter sp. UR6-1 TaxID=1435643 RepID=UPI001E4F2F95|nr:DUF3298 and DUF4163 domain-containing protein [Mucilaginibacter sp. UR6-1]MCC8408132.1 DUF3298 and DUF4163 domain-containing protein [Mucilaginibacter sp. UR6-1]